MAVVMPGGGPGQPPLVPEFASTEEAEAWLSGKHHESWDNQPGYLLELMDVNGRVVGHQHMPVGFLAAGPGGMLESTQPAHIRLDTESVVSADAVRVFWTGPSGEHVLHIITNTDVPERIRHVRLASHLDPGCRPRSDQPPLG